jgi:ribosomal protein S18 acetylase RimI-like enzyme
MDTMKEIMFRSAEPADASLIANFLAQLAEYERLSHVADIDVTRLEQHLAWNYAPHLYAIIAEYNGVTVGMAIYYMRYSTFTTSWGMHLEDLYVIEPYRSQGFGRAFFVILARIAQKHGYSHIDFSVLEWNTHARRMYESIGALASSEWIHMRLEGNALRSLATQPEQQRVQIRKEE